MILEHNPVKSFLQTMGLLMAMSLPVDSWAKYEIEKGSQFPLCQDLKRILNAPENKNYMKGYYFKDVGHYDTLDFNIPKGFKDFKSVKWEKVDPKEYSTLVGSREAQGVLQRIKNLSLNAKLWDGKGDYTIEKAHVDYDHDGMVDTILRYRLPRIGWWNIMFPDTEKYYLREENQRLANDSSTIFYYQGRIFRGKDLDGLMVYEPRILHSIALTDDDTPGDFYELIQTDVCELKDR